MCSVVVWENWVPGLFHPPQLQDAHSSDTLQKHLHDAGVFTFFLEGLKGSEWDRFRCLCKFPPTATGGSRACHLDSASVLARLMDNRDKQIVVYVHGNAECVHTSFAAQNFVTADLERIYVTFEWQGYQSKSQTSPTFESQCIRLLAVLRFLSDTPDDRSLSIVLLGFSLGCAVILRSVQLARLPAEGPSTVDVVRMDRVRFVCLLAPFLSGPAVIFQNTIFEDVFAHLFSPMNNADAVGMLQTPMLAIHGTRDSIIPKHHSKELSRYFDASTYNRRHRSRFVYVEDATHSTLLHSPHVRFVIGAIKTFSSECESSHKTERGVA
ncbi:hypothetical protein CYMTET_35648 [Cymbomonas tetramitiformis]|uniref:Serine hydrolase domain-containing protein n=1 Tax=Cymbomonas tetramitiformis TaxID=36881 RepID=A0AAE0F8Y5_9CHLO|nr:hypothetical protein CYMTET_35648 [Cymbomonas tetramitiformis]|eukprot:gene50-73_t